MQETDHVVAAGQAKHGPTGEPGAERKGMMGRAQAKKYHREEENQCTSGRKGEKRHQLIESQPRPRAGEELAVPEAESDPAGEAAVDSPD